MQSVRLATTGLFGEAALEFALLHGYFERAAIDLQPVEFARGDLKSSFAALISGDLEVAAPSVGADLFNAGVAGKLGIILALGALGPGSPAGLVLHNRIAESHAMESDADLRGLTIAISGRGDTTDYLAWNLVHRAGLGASGVCLKTIDSVAMSAALGCGRVDAAFLDGPATVEVVKAGGGVKWRAWGDIMPGVQPRALAVSQGFAANRDLSVSWLAAYLAAARDYNAQLCSTFERVSMRIESQPTSNMASIDDQLRWCISMRYTRPRVSLGHLVDSTIAAEATSRLDSLAV